jgi:hypothetical protein
MAVEDDQKVDSRETLKNKPLPIFERIEEDGGPSEW